MPPKSGTGKRGSRKIGRNLKKCERYKKENRRDKNKRKKQARYKVHLEKCAKRRESKKNGK
jgi:hypothetical protein